MWYVIQVDTGSEEHTLELIKKIIDVESFGRAFLPKVVFKKKIRNEWQDLYRPFIPGYMFFETDNPQKLFFELKIVPKHTTLLRIYEDIIPVSTDEERFIKSLLSTDDILEISTGYKDGDKVIIDCGPLKGREAIITKINAHKRTAVVSTEMFGRRMKLKLGIEMLPTVHR